MLVVVVAAAVFLLLGFLVGVGFAISRATQRQAESDRRVLNVAMVLNGNVEYTQTTARAFQHELESELKNTPYIARIEIAEGSAEKNREANNRTVFNELLARFSTKPDYLVTFETQVTILQTDTLSVK